MSDDRARIADLVARYAVAVDRRDAAALGELFAPEAEVLVPAALGGPTIFTDWDVLIGSISRFERTRHVVHQQVLDIGAGVATGETYADAHHLYRRDGGLRDRAVALRYLDKFGHDGTAWRFRRRELVVDWISDGPVR